MTYVYHDEAVSYVEAQTKCTTSGHRLTMPKTAEKQADLESFMVAEGVAADVWIGVDDRLWDTAEGGKYVWNDGKLRFGEVCLE